MPNFPIWAKVIITGVILFFIGILILMIFGLNHLQGGMIGTVFSMGGLIIIAFAVLAAIIRGFKKMIGN